MAANCSRRTLLRCAALAPAASLGLLSACAQESQKACFDPQYLGAGEAQMRKTLQYIAVSESTVQQCTHCVFYRSGAEAGCGECEIVGGPVHETGYCTSWATGN